jgi:hypothetical protein
MLDNDLPLYEKTLERMFQEAHAIIGGGILTISWAPTIAGFHIADKRNIFQKLRAELLQAVRTLLRRWIL